MFILHAEHEMNCSTAAARHLASSGVDVYTAISGARLSAQVCMCSSKLPVSLPVICLSYCLSVCPPFVCCPLPAHKHPHMRGFPCTIGAVGALYGPLHGGANEAVLRMLERIGKVENIPKFIEGVKNRKEKMFGFGHRYQSLCLHSLGCCHSNSWKSC